MGVSGISGGVKIPFAEPKSRLINIKWSVTNLTSAALVKDSAETMLLVSSDITPPFLLLSSIPSYSLFINFSCELVSACGIGCQYGDCDSPIPWYPLPASPPNYTSGACMREVFNHFFDKTDHHPVCHAKEVNSFMATLIDGPSSCERGTIIAVNFTASFHVNSATGRHDIGSSPSVQCDSSCFYSL